MVSGGPRIARANGVAAFRRAAFLIALLGVFGLMSSAPARLQAFAGKRHPRAGELQRFARHGFVPVIRGSRHDSQRGRAAIVGGTPITIATVPWQVEVEAFADVLVEEEQGELFKVRLVGYCGGSILSTTRVLTAGHCLINPQSGALISPSEVEVLAGSAQFDPEHPPFVAKEPGEQVRTALRVRMPTNYDPESVSESADDIAVITLTTPLTLGSDTKTIALGTPGEALAEGTSLNMSGSGEESQAPPVFSGGLYSLTTTLGYSRPCGGEADALFLCTHSASGSLCFGDSGSGLTLPGIPQTLVGVADTTGLIEGEPCRATATDGFANVTAPELHDFIEETEPIPLAPRGGGAVIRGVPEVGYSFTCEPGSWTNDPTYTYAFVNSANAQVLQEGASARYLIPSTAVGATVLCEVRASNAGGTGIGRTQAFGAIAGLEQATKTVNFTEPGAIEPGPINPKAIAEFYADPSVRATATSLAVSNGGAVVKLACTGSRECHGKLTLTAKRTTRVKGKRHVTTVVIGTASFSIAGGGQARVKIKLSAFGRAQVKATHGHLQAVLETVGYETEPTHKRSQDVTIL